MAEFRMPKLGADMSAGKLVAWRKKPGERIERGEIIAVVETDKTAIEVESFVTGVLEKVLVEPGDSRIPVGTPLAIMTVEAGTLPPIEAPRTEVAAPRAAESAPLRAAARGGPEVARPAPEGARAKASPAARRRALELGIQLGTVPGTGPEGRITLEDVEQAASARPAPAPAAPESRQQRMRYAIAAAMARSKREIPHYYLATTIDMSKLDAWLEAANRERPIAERLVYGVLLVKAVALALREVPELNGFWIEGRAAQSEAIHPGVAISLRGGGLVAPALHDADRRTLDDLMAAFSDLVKRARAGSLKSSEVTAPTITITSLGERGVESLFGIIYPPQLALVGFGKPVERPWVAEGRVCARRVITATLSGDHRATDGHRGALFLDALGRLLQEPEKL